MLKIKTTKFLITILSIILCILLVLSYNFVFYKQFAYTNFVNQALNLIEENKNPVFKIHKITLYSSANAVDVSDTQALSNIDICQFTDIAIYIDNTSSIYDITNENTISSLYIDNIQIRTNSDIGTQYIDYKSPLNFAKYTYIENPNKDRIDFNIVSTNQENESTDYSFPTFYTDCSNPITLEYMNTDIIKNYAVSDESNTLSFSGKILEEANVNLDDINYTISFNINIVNNLGEKFTNNLILDVDLSEGAEGGIYKGYVTKTFTVSGDKYNFLKSVAK